MTIELEDHDFCKHLAKHEIRLKRSTIKTLQINVGKLCNQSCAHCHVDAGPNRTEVMEKKTVDRLLELLAQEPTIDTVDLTGGAPELNPWFRTLVTASRALGKEVMDRCNLTVLFEPNQETTAQFLCDQKVQVIASLPCYTEDNVDLQRGKGVFEKSIKALRLLNDLGYGKEDSRLVLNLVYNPVGASLPADQKVLENDYKEHLKDNFGVVFNQLFTITNMPIGRYSRYLQRKGQLNNYVQLLVDNFNEEAAKNVMCLDMLSISWDGKIYDCDFNQMLELPVKGAAMTIWEIERFSDLTGDLAHANHCYGCTAGSGSSCGGALV